MSTWAALLPVAMVGTERQAPVLPEPGGAIGDLLAELAVLGDHPAQCVLQMAAVLATCAQAGVQGTAWLEPVPAAAAREVLPTVDNASAVLLLAWALRDGPQRLLLLVFQSLARKGRRLPIDLLPLALEQGRRSVALRESLQPVLGERGVWLAGQNAAWNYAFGVEAAAAEEVRWTEGSLAQRRELLREERRRNPSAARERLTGILGELPARERAELIGELATGLSMDDEALLDSLRRDRSREVKQVTLGLLQRLPDCAHVQRAQQRMQALLRQERVLLRKRWRLDAPSAVADEWKADGIEATRPTHDALGERAWWLFQVARQVPLAWWVRYTGMNPGDLVDWAISSDWADALLRAWREALAVEPEVAWCEALLDHSPKTLSADHYLAILALLPLARRERYWEKQLKEGKSRLQALVHQLLQACPPGECLSASLSLAVASAVAEAVGQHADFSNDYALRSALPELCCVLQGAALEQLPGISGEAAGKPALPELWHTLRQIIATRQALNC